MTNEQMKALEIIAKAVADNAEVSKKALDIAKSDSELLSACLSLTTGVELATPQTADSLQAIPPMPPSKIEYPVLDTPVDAPLKPTPAEDPFHSYVDPTKMFEMRLRTIKPCDSCPFAATCEERNTSRLTKDCPEDILQAKRISVQPGEIYMDVKVHEENNRMFTTFHAYKDGLFLGDLWTETENKFARSILELYSGERVFLHITPLKMRGKFVFTTLMGEILRSESLSEAPMFSNDIEPPEQEEVKPVLDFKYSI